MKYFVTLFIAIQSFHYAVSQPLTIGYSGGISMSDSHGDFISARSKSVALPVTGLFMQCSLLPFLSISTGLDYTRQEYERKMYVYNSTGYPSSYLSLSSPTITSQLWNFDFIRVPLYLTLNSPTRLQVSVSAGIYASFQIHDNYSVSVGYPYYTRRVTDTPNPPRHDNGLMYGASLSYPINDVFRFFGSGRYYIGHKNFMDAGMARTGASEIIFGLAYHGFFRGEKNQGPPGSVADSGYHHFLLLPGAGIAISSSKSSEDQDSYKSIASFSAGARLEYRLDKRVSVVSGFAFERKGYRFESDATSGYVSSIEGSQYNNVQTMMEMDYLVVPLLLKLRMGSVFKIYFEGGIRAGFNLNSRVTGHAESEYVIESGFYKYRIEIYDDIEGYIRDFELGWSGGGGIEFPVGKNNHFYIGLNCADRKSIFADRYLDSWPEGSNDHIRTGTVSIHTGLVIPLSPVR